MTKIDEGYIADHARSMSKSVFIKDVIYELSRAGISPEEYVRFDFFNKDEAQRASFISDLEIIRVLKSRSNNILPEDKYTRYCMFKAYFKRSVMNANFSSTEEDAYHGFIQGKKEIVVKPLYGTKGKGVSLVETSAVPNLNLLKTLIGVNCLLEDRIIQSSPLADFHPGSVNTIRYVTAMLSTNSVIPLFALLRVGQGDSFVDNVGKGGLIAMIELDTGRVCSDAFCGPSVFAYHPDTKVAFQGTQIPQWVELKSLAISIHSEFPKQRVFGFDFAWTPAGWDLVEVNPAPSFASYQAITDKGFRPQMQKYGLL